MKISAIASVTALAFALAATCATAQTPRTVPPVGSTAYPGTLTVQIDATDLDRRIFRVKQSVPVKAGPLTLLYPQWPPGEHAPTGPIGQFAGLRISAAGQTLAWRRDPLDVYAFHLDVPLGVARIELEFQFLSPMGRGEERVVMTREMLGLQWRSVLLYPAGHPVTDIAIQASLRLPEGWSHGSALEVERKSGAVLDFKTVSVDKLVDSPVFAGRHMKRFDLDPEAPAAGRPPVFLNVVTDKASELDAKPEHLAVHQALVTQADRLFGARHFGRYEFLLALSDEFGGIGLEHHESSENGVGPGYFTEWAKRAGARELLPHEYAHSWNGKFRRPADLLTANFNTPGQDSLLWMYEGQTQYWGEVLAARSGMRSLAETRDAFAMHAAQLDTQSGRRWRNLQDTTNDRIVEATHSSGAWRDWQRGDDYYMEMLLVWLEADMLIRDLSGGVRSLDDFARSFFGVEPGRIAPLPYSFDTVVAELNRVQAHDWATFLRQRLDTHGPGAPLGGLERSGWQLGWAEQPSEMFKSAEGYRRSDDFRYSIGFGIGKDGKLRGVKWGGPAFEAGLSSAVTVVAVNGRAYKAEVLKEALTAARADKAPIQLLVREGELFRTVPINYSGGLRYPILQRIDGTEDRLSVLLAPRP
ncbi:MAG: peptidase M61 [Burkholderiales bacterium]|nr:peptidase M61 [Burkholderiales bacterium]